MDWTPERVKAFRMSRGQNQTAFALDAGVDRVTVSRWETGSTPVSDLNAARLDALAATPRDVSRDYWRGVLYACESMSGTVAQLLREAREDEDAQYRARTLAADAPMPSASADQTPASPRPEKRGELRRRVL